MTIVLENLSPQQIESLCSLENWELLDLLKRLSEEDQVRLLVLLQDPSRAAVIDDEHSRDMARKRQKRSQAAEVFIPEPADIKRRERCLDDPERFLRTYGYTSERKHAFYMPFAVHHKKLIQELHDRAETGGDKALAAPRGEGKTTIIVWMIIYILMKQLRRHPVAIARTRGLAFKKIFSEVKFAFEWEDGPLGADFPEISAPVQDLDGASGRGAKQHVDGHKTNITWTLKELRFPHVPGSPYGGCSFTYYGFDAAIRGERSDFAVIDDPEDKFVARDRDKNKKIEEAIDGDVAGLAGPTGSLPRVIVTTIQSRKSYSYRVTSRDVKEGGRPTFAGDRYGILKKWPTCWTDDKRENHWENYIALRQRAQAEGDKDGWPAVAYYETHHDEMHEGAKLTNPHRFDHGNPAEKTALQAFFNKIADLGLPRVMAEYQNNPDKDDFDESLGLVAGTVAKRLSGLRQNELPPNKDVQITYGCDVGKYLLHWVKVAWHGNAIGNIIDYGRFETIGNLDVKTAPADVQIALVQTFVAWRNHIIAEHEPEFGLTDSGDYKDAVYEAIRQAGGTPFAAAKGWDTGRFNVGEESENRKPYLECYASWQENDKLWLYNVHTEWWKHWLQERFITPTLNDYNEFNDGAISLFSDPDNPKRHLRFSNHIVAEGRETVFTPGKKSKTNWVEHHTNNHFLDALALACAAAGVIGVRLIKRTSLEVPETVEQTAQPKKPTRSRTQDRLIQRPGGWVQGSRRRR